MPYEEYRLRKPEREPESDFYYKFKQFIMANFPEETAKRLYGIGIDTIAIFAKIGVYLTLPFKFLQFFHQSWRNQKNKNINRVN